MAPTDFWRALEDIYHALDVFNNRLAYNDWQIDDDEADTPGLAVLNVIDWAYQLDLRNVHAFWNNVNDRIAREEGGWYTAARFEADIEACFDYFGPKRLL